MVALPCVRLPQLNKAVSFSNVSLCLAQWDKAERGAYALNIGGKEDQTTNTGMDAAAWSDKVPLFETAKGKDNTLGFTIGTPQIGRVSIKRETDGSAKLNEKHPLRRLPRQWLRS